jgi:hypothetical protein
LSELYTFSSETMIAQYRYVCIQNSTIIFIAIVSYLRVSGYSWAPSSPIMKEK